MRLADEIAVVQGHLTSAAQQREHTTEFVTGIEERLRLLPDRQGEFDKEMKQLVSKVQQEQQRERDLRRRDLELSNALTAEQNRWTDFNSRLDELERALSVGGR